MTHILDAAALEALAERCEAASGADRELDHAVRAEVFGDAGYCGDEGWLCGACSAPAHELAQEPGCGCPMGLSDERTSYPNDWRDDERLLKFSTSLDAAMSLVPAAVMNLIDLQLSWEPSEPAVHPACAVTWYPPHKSGPDWHALTVSAATPALALTAAALRALASQARARETSS